MSAVWRDALCHTDNPRGELTTTHQRPIPRIVSLVACGGTTTSGTTHHTGELRQQQHRSLAARVRRLHGHGVGAGCVALLRERGVRCGHHRQEMPWNPAPTPGVTGLQQNVHGVCRRAGCISRTWLRGRSATSCSRLAPDDHQTTTEDRRQKVGGFSVRGSPLESESGAPLAAVFFHIHSSTPWATPTPTPSHRPAADVLHPPHACSQLPNARTVASASAAVRRGWPAALHAAHAARPVSRERG
jgi:hypothetical protein